MSQHHLYLQTFETNHHSHYLHELLSTDLVALWYQREDQSFALKGLYWKKMLSKNQLDQSIKLIKFHEGARLIRSFILSVSKNQYLGSDHQRLLQEYLDLTQHTNFFQKVLMTTLEILPGQRMSYSELAHIIGHPLAFRSVAKVLSTNPYQLLFPCHRVVAKSGALSGYAGGLEMKRRLLESERSS